MKLTVLGIDLAKKVLLFSSRLIAFASVPPAAPTALPAQHPSRAGPAAAVWRPALAAPGGRH